VYSAQAALVAEELDLDWQDIRVDPGPPSAAYYNGKVLAEGLPFAATDNGFLANKARVLGDVLAKLLGVQVTGGSSTVADAYEKMRMAGAAAREVLLLAAEKQTGIAKAYLKTKGGTVVTPDGRSLSYSSLAMTAATIDAPTTVKLKPETEWRYLGKSMPRIDMVAKCTGTTIYGIDLRIPGMVYATVRSNPRLGGDMKGFDAANAEKSKGVIKVVPMAGGVGVIADNTWRAFKAANLIRFDWDPAPYPASTEAMFDAVAASFIRARQDSRLKNEGNVEAALTGAGVIEAEYKVPYLAHAPLEPMNVVVQLKDGRLDIWTGTQIPMFLVKNAASMVGLRTEDVYLHARCPGAALGGAWRTTTSNRPSSWPKRFPPDRSR
jgi:isoquinoline 1-oxidoreductase subunit beta